MRTLLVAALAPCSLLLCQQQQNEFVGAQQCFGCHDRIFRSFRSTDMGKSMRLASELTPGAIPPEAAVAVPSSNRLLRVAHDPSGWRQSESEPGVFADEHPLQYVIGSGTNGLSFVVAREQHLFQAPLSFYSRTGQWGLSPGYQYADLGFSRPITAECALCHSGRPQPVESRRGEYRKPAFQELAIGCESCHGPGQLHVRSPRRAGSIVNPAKLPARLAEEICLRCHQGGDARVLQPGKRYADFRPGTWLIDTLAIFQIAASGGPAKESDLLEHHAAMKSSRCFRESGGKLSCLTCHDPHVQPRGPQTTAYFREKCLICHEDKSCRLPLAARAPADDCIGCHMAKRSVTSISHSMLTNHRIPARTDAPARLEGAPGGPELVLFNVPAEQRALVPDITVLRAYGEVADRSPVFQQRYVGLLARLAETQPDAPYVQAALGHKLLAEGKSAEALAHLTAGLRLDEAAVDADLAQAMANLGRRDEASVYWESAVAKDPYNATYLKSLILQYINGQRYGEAQEQMRRYLETFPEDSFMRGLLGRVTK